jgi:TetR/AcrR family transcriptional repressor of nem operon
MKVSRAEAAQNRERILDTAARLFRERGFDGIGVAEVMQSAGLTHGGFYGHFASKEDLMVQACARAIEDSQAAFRQVSEHGGDKPLKALASAYLSAPHCDNPGDGCVLAALGSEAARRDSPLRSIFTKAVRGMADMLAEFVPGKTQRAKRQGALAIYASLVGAMVLARAVDDPRLSKEILQSVLASDLLK